MLCCAQLEKVLFTRDVGLSRKASFAVWLTDETAAVAPVNRKGLPANRRHEE